ncbi:FecR family protein [Chitinophaga defluvii]|uniref:FecR domain-containing protein n=1 Tax=Chitinophaga defluvii TaxID=3163343 RepID=A0ABV2T4U9_9BACT
MEYELLMRFFNGECTREEVVAVENWLATAEEEWSVMDRLLEDAWQEPASATLGDADSHRILEEMKSKLVVPRQKRVTPMRGRILKAMAAAASIAVMIAIGAGWWYLKKQPVGKATQQLAATWQTIKNETGNTRKLVMPDGTAIWLTPYSTLSYNIPYGTISRKVQLEGEAYFEVAPDEQHPFTVYTGNITTRVLGTTFNIEAYAAEPAIRVSLTSGKVMVSNTDSLQQQQSQVLEPGHMLACYRGTRKMELMQLAVKDNSVWTKGYLVFNDIPLEQAILRVARRYGWTVGYAGNKNQLPEKKVTAIFRHETGLQIIQNLLFVHGYHCSLNGSNLLITP